MGMDRYFQVFAETKCRELIYDPDLAKRVDEALDDIYGPWQGSVYHDGCLEMDGANWYDCIEDMEAISKKFPDLLFTVICSGCGLDDMWIAGFCDGRCDLRCAEIPPLNMNWLLNGERTEKGENDGT